MDNIYHYTMKSKIFVILIMVLLVVSFSATATTVEGESADPQITVYVVPPITDVKILPTTSISDSYISNDISIIASPGEYEPASFVVRPHEDITALEVEATQLIGEGGSIPSSNIDIRVVKCWYQAGTGIWDNDHKLLTPELLLKDDSLVKVEDGENYLKFTTGEYVWISEVGHVGDDVSIPNADFPVQDNATLQPVNISQGTNKQFWITVKVPDDSPAGIYTGTVELRTTELIGELQLEIEVLPFELSAPSLITSIGYNGYPSSSGTIGNNRKSETQFRAELQDMIAHGVTNPADYIGWGWGDAGTWWSGDKAIFDNVLRIRNEEGMGSQPLYTYCAFLGTTEDYSTAITDPAKIQALKSKTEEMVALIQSYGYPEVYIYGVDEARGQVLLDQRASWEAVHEAGGKVWTAGHIGAFDLVGDLLDLFECAEVVDPAEAAKWHSVGHQIFSYSNPQGGEERPERYRRNYGLLLWQGDYDGGLTFAYQVGFGTIWNDFDHNYYRDHNMTYPTIDGVIDTVQWEGFREGVDDVGYLTTLLNVIDEASTQGKDTSEAENYLANLKASDLTTKDLDVVRSEMIDHILYLLEEAPLAEFSATPTTGNEPLDIQFTDQSTGSITSWLWDFGDEATSTEQNPLHTYTSAGVYTVSLTVAGSPSDTETKMDYISVYEPAPFIPGDANEDGVVNSLDITKVKRIIMGLDEPTPGADANGDGNINAIDITQIELIIMGS